MQSSCGPLGRAGISFEEASCEGCRHSTVMVCHRRLRLRWFTATSVFCDLGGAASAQPAPAFPNPAITLDGRGITLHGTHSVTKLNFRFRVQQLALATSESETDYRVKRTNLAVRRMRVRMEGTLRDPRLRVNVQLSFARGDTDKENSGVANVLRDAFVTWQFTPHFAGSFGQAKLPGNRQRLVSSSELQSAYRSPVNAL